MIKKISIQWLPFVVIISALIYSLSLANLNSKNLYLMTFVIMTIVSSFLFGRELKGLWNYFKYFMFNLEKTVKFKKRIERPRLFIYLTFGTLQIISFYQLLHIEDRDFFDLDKIFFFHLFFIVYWLSATILFFTWTKNFIQNFIPETQKRMLETKKKKFYLKWNKKEEYRQLYDNLNDANFIIPLKTDAKSQDYTFFINSLSKGVISEEPLFKLEMDNVQTKLFYDLISDGSKGFPLKTFLKIFKNKNGSPKPSSIYASTSKNKSGAKKGNVIIECFDF